MLLRNFEHVLARALTGLGLMAIACSSNTNDTASGLGTETSSSTTTDSGGDVAPTSSDSTTTDSGTMSATGTTTSSEPTASTASETESGDPTTSTTEAITSTESTTTSTTTSTSTTDETTETEGSSATESTSTTEAPPDCEPTEVKELTCDGIDNNCDGVIDNVDAGGDGICDCLNILILGATGFAPSSNFEAWLEQQGSSVTRQLLANNPGAVTPALLANYDLVLVDRIERELSPEEADAIEAFVKDDGRGMITLIGYNFDNSNPIPERDRANTVLAPFGLAYQGNYFGDGVTPIFDQSHPISMGIFDVNFAGGIRPADVENLGTSEIFATVQGTDAGLAHQTDMNGGRVIVWGDEWITFDSDWQGYADVQSLWVNMVGWAKPKDFCGAPQ